MEKSYASSVKRLERDGLIKVEKDIRNGRSVSIVTYKKWQDFFTIEELEEMKISPSSWMRSRQ